MEEVKVICCDVDGTLVRSDKSLGQESVKWVGKAVNEAGIPFVIVTGRPASGVKRLYEMLGIKGPVSCFNGGTLVDENGTIVDDHRLAHDISVKLVDIKRKAKDMDMIIFDGTKWFLEDKDCYCYQAKREIYDSEPGIGDFYGLLDRFDSNKAIFISPDPAALEKVAKEIKDRIGDLRITLYRSGDFLEVMGNDYDKGSAVTALARLYGIKETEVMALGDDYNDIPMLAKAGVSVAMGNAVPEAREVARYTTDTNDNDGVAKAIKRFVFNLV